MNFAVIEVDSASSKKLYLAVDLPRQRQKGVIVFWVWCTMHLNHAIQGSILAAVVGALNLMSALYAGSLLMRCGTNWLRVCGAIHEVVRTRLEIRRSAPPLGARMRSRLLIDFVAEGLGGLGQKDPLESKHTY